MAVRAVDGRAMVQQEGLQVAVGMEEASAERAIGEAKKAAVGWAGHVAGQPAVGEVGAPRAGATQAEAALGVAGRARGLPNSSQRNYNQRGSAGCNPS